MAILNPKAVLQTSSGGGGTAGVSSLNGEAGALSLKTIGGQSPLGVGDIPTGGGGGSGYDPSFKLVDTAAFRRFYAGNSIVGRGIAQNTVVACPFVMQKNVSITELGIHVQTGGTAGVARLFIFGSLPNGRWDYSNVIYSGTPIDAVAVGTKMLTVSPTVELQAGVKYWFMIWTGGTSAPTIWQSSRPSYEIFSAADPMHSFTGAQTYSGAGVPSATLLENYSGFHINPFIYKDGSTS